MKPEPSPPSPHLPARVPSHPIASPQALSMFYSKACFTWVEDVVQMVECLQGTHEALGGIMKPQVPFPAPRV